MPKFRNLWEHIGTAMPKKGRGRAGRPRPPQSAGRTPDRLGGSIRALPRGLRARGGGGHQSAALFHRRLQQHLDLQAGPTTTSPASSARNDDGSTTLQNGRLELFRNFDEDGTRFPRPRTLLIDSEQLESGEALDRNFPRLGRR